ncbi:uncharacterized protein LOC104895629 [Beta vulgaris subsp. vulgaris]|uniref:uncharacterized protein LOC104895629 n=1 Tax=Beta vulgaris subsp. vulgaris TaxID=3555 RepID=UPI002547B1FD|nr:uncharacterized protein LOC104895629 [Beta vulgaris subsp. vulgaris]
MCEGNGQNIDIWISLVGDRGRFIESERCEHLTVVGDLIDYDRMEWRCDLIEQNFNERDQHCILSIPLSSRAGSDGFMWAYSKDGCYTVKTAYMLGKALKARHIVDEALCPWCRSSEETVFHALMGCVRVRYIWVECGCEALLGAGEATDFCELLVKWGELEAKMVQRGCFLAWNLWNERNKYVFENIRTPLEVVAQRVFRQAEEYSLYVERIYAGSRKQSSPSPNKWCAPPSGLVKVNADASVNGEGWVGLGAVARDDKGSVLFSAVRRTRAWWPPDVAEAKAIYMAVLWAKHHGLKEVVIESDAQVLVSRLSSAALFHSDLDAILGDIINLCSWFNIISFSHVRRDGNYVAHHLAKVVPFGYEQRWEFHCPSIVYPYVLSDVLSLD